MSSTTVGEAGLLGDRYVLQGLIGRGGMGEVYRAHDRVLGRSVAVKLMRSVVGDGAERARFTDEARALARLSHPGLVTMLDAATADDEPYLVMELINGPSLTECCRGGALEPARVAVIGAQLADALHHAHEAGVVHRDLKPDNVLLAADDRALLTDFGIARLMSDTTRHTVTGVTLGTAAYLAPEQVCGGKVTPATDVYALGLVLLEALTGERAYRGLPIEAALARLTTPPTIPDTVPSSWHGLLRSMTALEPAERPSCDEVALSLRELASGVGRMAATAAIPTGSVGAASLVRTPGGSRHGEPADTLPLELDVQGQSDRLLDHWRWIVGAVVLALLFALAGSSGQSDEQGMDASLPATVSEELKDPPRVEPARDRDRGDQTAEPQDEARRKDPSGDVEQRHDERDTKRADRGLDVRGGGRRGSRNGHGSENRGRRAPSLLVNGTRGDRTE